MLILGVKISGELQEFPIQSLPVSIGRRHDNNLRIKDKFISAYHAELRRNADGDLELHDKGSFNGTFVNGRRLKDEPVTVGLGDSLKLGVLDSILFDDQDARSCALARGNTPVVVPLRERRSPGSLSASKAAGETRTVALAPEPVGARSGAMRPGEVMLPLAAKAALEPADTKGLQQKEDQISALQADLKRAQDEAKGLREAKQSADRRLAEVEEALAASSGATAKAKEEQDVLRSRVETLEKTTSLGRDSQKKAQDEAAQANAKLVEETARLTTLLGEKEKAAEVLEQRLQQVQGEREKSQNQSLKEAEARQATLEEENRTLQKALDEQTRTLAGHRQAQQQAAEEKSALEKSLLRQIEVKEAAIAGTKGELEAALAARDTELTAVGREKLSLQEALDAELTARQKAEAEAADLVTARSRLESALATRDAELTQAEEEKLAQEQAFKAEIESRAKALAESRMEAETVAATLAATKEELAAALAASTAQLTKVGEEKTTLEQALNAELDVRTRALAEATKEASAQAAALAALKQELDVSAGRLAKLGEERTALEKSLTAELEAGEKALADTEEKARSTADALASSRGELQDALQKAEALAAESGRQQARLQELENALVEKAEMFKLSESDHLSVLSHTQGELALAKDALASSEADLRKREQALTEREDLIGKLRADLEATQEEASSKGQKMAGLLAQVAVLGATTAKVRELEEVLAARDQEIVQLKSLPAGDPERETLLQAEVESARFELTRLETQLAEREAELRQARNRHESTLLLLEETQACSDSNSEETSRMVSRVKELEQALVGRGEEITRLEQQRGDTVGSLTTEIGELKSELQRTREELAENLSGRERAETEVNRLNGRVEGLDAELKKLGAATEATRQGLEQDRSALSQEVTTLRATLEKSEASLAEASHQLESHRSSLDETRQTLTSVQGLADSREQEASRLGSRVAELVAGLAARSVDVTMANEAMEKAQKELGLARGEIEDLKHRITVLDAERTRVLEGRASVDALHEEVANQSSELERYRKATEAARQEHRQFSRETAETRARLETHLDELDAKIKDARAAFEHEEHQAYQARQQAEQQLSRVGELSKNISAHEAELSALQSRLEAEKRESQQLEHILLPLREEKAGMSAELSGLQASLASTITEVTAKMALRDELKAAEKRLREIEGNTRRLQDEAATAQHQITKSQEHVRDLMKQRDTLDQELNGQQRKLERRLRDLQLAEDRIQLAADLDEQITSRQAEVAEKSHQLELVTNTVKHLQEERAMLNESLRKLKGDLSQLGSGRNGAVVSERNGSVRDHQIVDLEKKIKEYEDYQRILRESLRPDLATVEVMSRQIIKRIDLLDDLIILYRKDEKTQAIGDQLIALKQGFLDMLDDHFVKPYSLDPGTPLNVNERRRITIVESRAGDKNENQKGLTRVFKTVRPGYICGGVDAPTEQILRKAEVITMY
ncbi:MAG: FHA domain-containing protein [Verrucomicrobiales bacterium]